MSSKTFDLILVQETKLHQQYVFDCDEYMVAATSPVEGVGGLQTLLAKKKELRILWTRTLSPRVLAVAFAWGREKWCAINVYMPTSAASQLEYEEEWKFVVEAWTLAKRNGLSILTGGDLNARLGGHRDDIHIGSAVTGGLHTDMKHRASVAADALQIHGLAAWSTLIGPPHTTWTSPHDTEAQLDYLIGDFVKFKRFTNIAIEPLDRIPSDHKIVWGELDPPDCAQRTVTRLRPKACKIKGPDHDLAIRLALTTADHSAWKSEPNPVDAISGCLKLVREIAKKAPAPKAVIKQDWIGEESWTAIRRGAEFRRRLEATGKLRRKAAMRWAWTNLSASSLVRRDGALQTACQPPPVEGWMAERCSLRLLLWMMWRTICKRQSKVVQRLVRKDKAVWISSKTEELARIEQEGVSSETHKHVKRCLTKIRQNHVAVKRGPIRDAAGALKTTQDEKEIVWQEHWSRLYAGKMLNETKSFTSVPQNWTSDSLGEVSAEAKFSEAEVEAALKHQMTNKASVDGIPAKQLRCILPHLVPTWTRAFNYFLEVGNVPHIYK
eukprot:4839657-Amphidinium_carterae.1